MRIEWDTGFLRIDEYTFFPLVQTKARILFRTLRDCCDEAEKKKVYRHLKDTEVFFRYCSEDEGDKESELSTEYVAHLPRFYYAEHECKALHKKAVSNLKLFEKMCGVYDVSGGEDG